MHCTVRTRLTSTCSVSLRDTAFGGASNPWRKNTTDCSLRVTTEVDPSDMDITRIVEIRVYKERMDDTIAADLNISTLLSAQQIDMLLECMHSDRASMIASILSSCANDLHEIACTDDENECAEIAFDCMQKWTL